MNDYSPGWTAQDMDFATYVGNAQHMERVMKRRAKEKEKFRQRMARERQARDLERRRKQYILVMKELRAAFKVSELLETIHFCTF